MQSPTQSWFQCAHSCALEAAVLCQLPPAPPTAMAAAFQQSASTTDEEGNSIFYLCVADTRDPGCGRDHYSARFRKMGEAQEGTHIGACVYPCGRNSWFLRFEDADGDCVPDKFTKSNWISHDGGSQPDDWPFSGRIDRPCCAVLRRISAGFLYRLAAAFLLDYE